MLSAVYAGLAGWTWWKEIAPRNRQLQAEINGGWDEADLDFNMAWKDRGSVFIVAMYQTPQMNTVYVMDTTDADASTLRN